jgi:hypothetical protein
MHFHRFAPAWNDSMYGRNVPSLAMLNLLAFLMQPSFGDAAQIIIRLKLPSKDIFQGSVEEKIYTRLGVAVG